MQAVVIKTAEESTIVVRRVGELEREGVFLVFGGVFEVGTKAVAVELVPKVGVEIHIDRGEVIFYAAHGNNLLTYGPRQVVGDTPADIEIISGIEPVVEILYLIQPLAIGIVNVFGQIAGDYEVEVSSAEA